MWFKNKLKMDKGVILCAKSVTKCAILEKHPSELKYPYRLNRNGLTYMDISAQKDKPKTWFGP